MMNTREEFEKWAKDKGWDLERWGVAYRYPATDNCWIGWQSCQALNDKRIGGDISEWLKDGETIIQRLERERKDSASNLKLLAEERLKVEKLEEKLRVAREANVALVNFARDIIFPSNGAYAFSDFDGFDIQELALKHGLVKETTMTESCGENCTCAEYADSFPTQCNRATELIALKTIEG